jgi:HK97 family phage portal protein
MKRNTLPVPSMSSVKTSKMKSFFAPIFSFFPFSTGNRTFLQWPGGSNAKAPVNLSRSYGNVKITPELSLTISSVWACVWRYANTISSLPLELFRSPDDEDAVRDVKHPLYRILRDKPNQDMSAAKFWQAMVASMMTWDACYAKKLMFNGRLVGLKPLRPEFMTTYMTPEGRLRYRYAPAGVLNMGMQDFSADELFVVLDRSMDGYTGLSRIQYGANAMGIALSGENSASLMYKNGFRASGILTIAQWLKPEQRAAYKTIVNDFTGVGNGNDSDKQFGVLVAENATKFEPISLKPQDMELLASRKFSVEDICRFYDVPPVMIGHAVDGQTMWGSGVEQIILGWLKMGLGPVLTTIEAEIQRQLITIEDTAAGLYAQFNLEELLRGDTASRSSYASTMSQNGILTRNELRRAENKPRSNDPNADKLTVQSNMLPLDKLGTVPDSSAQTQSALKSWLGLDDKGDGK